MGKRLKEHSEHIFCAPIPVKRSFAKNDMTNFDYALTLKEKLGYEVFTTCLLTRNSISSEALCVCVIVNLPNIFCLKYWSN